MNKKLIAGVIAAVFVIAGIGGYVMLSRAKDSPQSNTTNESNNQPANTEAEATMAFSAIPNSSVPFEASLTGKGEREYKATLRYDGKGNSSYSSDYGDGPFTMFMFGDEHISCFGESCFRLPDADGDRNVSTVKQTYSESELTAFRDAATLRQEGVACGDDTCSVWDVKTDKFTGVFYLDSQKRMKKVEGEQDGNTWSMDYTYKPVTITRPTNVTDSPMF